MIALQPNPVFELNRIVSLSYVLGPAAVIDGLTALATALSAYQPFDAVRADILARMQQHDPAREAYETVIRLSGTEAERQFLTDRLNLLA